MSCYVRFNSIFDAVVATMMFVEFNVKRSQNLNFIVVIKNMRGNIKKKIQLFDRRFITNAVLTKHNIYTRDPGNIFLIEMKPKQSIRRISTFTIFTITIKLLRTNINHTGAVRSSTNCC